MNNSWAMEVFPSYLSRLTLGVEEVSAGVGASASLGVLVCRLLISSYCASICCIYSLSCCCSFLSCFTRWIVFSFFFSPAAGASVLTVERCHLPLYFHLMCSASCSCTLSNNVAYIGLSDISTSCRV